MSDTNDFISALSSGDMVKANDTFNSLMADKLNSALDDAKIQMAQGMLGADESEYEETYEEDNDEL